jgi:hypothetical protein
MGSGLRTRNGGRAVAWCPCGGWFRECLLASCEDGGGDGSGEGAGRTWGCFSDPRAASLPERKWGPEFRLARADGGSRGLLGVGRGDRRTGLVVIDG